jgi:hypothetical protein
VNRALKIIFGRKRNEVTADWRRAKSFVIRTHTNKRMIKNDEMDSACSVHEEMRSEYNILVGRPEKETTVRKNGRRCKDVKTDLTEIRFEGDELDSSD